jgi:hypothetical protein
MSDLLHVSSDDYYHDCPICQAQKKADKAGKPLSEAETLFAFEQASKIHPNTSYIDPDYSQKLLWQAQ